MKIVRFEDIESKTYTSKLDGSRRGATVRGFINYWKRYEEQKS